MSYRRREGTSIYPVGDALETDGGPYFVRKTFIRFEWTCLVILTKYPGLYLPAKKDSRHQRRDTACEEPGSVQKHLRLSKMVIGECRPK